MLRFWLSLILFFFAGRRKGGRRGYLIGWNTAAFKCLVVTLVTVDAETGLPTLDQVTVPMLSFVALKVMVLVLVVMPVVVRIVAMYVLLLLLLHHYKYVL